MGQVADFGSGAAILIPGRLDSERFPEKLLHPIFGKPLLQWTGELIQREVGEIPIVFAVDSEALAAVVEKAGFRAILTRRDHPTGTDRLAAANRILKADTIVNVQGDEPLVDGSAIRALIKAVEDGEKMATLAVPFKTVEDFLDPNQVKVLVNTAGRAIYFSRAALPFRRGEAGPPSLEWITGVAKARRHLGVYAYGADFLEEIVRMPVGMLEQAERLEQLRVIEAGIPIAVLPTEGDPIGIDVPEDVARLEAELRRRGIGG
ncbi:MAG: 3-deoxy-manno-octulosonate cytidylyltransferase [Puniceicoccaceae bacterium]